MNYKLKAQVSNKISNDDDTIIRIGKKTRNKLISGLNTHLEIWDNPFANSRLYKVRQAFSEDLALFPKNEREMIAFVSKHVYDKYVNSEGYINLSPKKTTCIGSDPEFIIFAKSGGEEYVMHAADVLAFESDIGSDGPLGELRASPGLTPEEHVDNLEELIGNIYSKLDPNEYKCRILPYMKSKWVHLHDYNNNTISERNSVFTCGGHIHFGLTQKARIKEINNLIVNIIDRLIAVCMHRVDMDMSAKRIDDGGYGYLADFKDEGISLEYRGLSGTWLLYKDLATVVLSVTNSLVENITVRINECFEDVNNNYWSIENGCSLNSNVETVENAIKNLYPEIKPIIEEYPYDIFELMFSKKPNSADTLRYINKVIECLYSIIDTSKLEPFANLVIADYNKYKNLDPNFIENWAGGVSVFDHLNK
jgi:hypothetical protein